MARLISLDLILYTIERLASTEPPNIEANVIELMSCTLATKYEGSRNVRKNIKKMIRTLPKTPPRK
jgi:hypothetical protein